VGHHITQPAHDLHGVVNHLESRAGDVQLRHGVFVAHRQAVVHHPRHLVAVVLHVFDLDRHVGDLFLNHLEAADRLAELNPLIGIHGGVFKGRLSRTNAGCRKHNALDLEVGHQLHPAVVELPDQRIFGQAHVVNEDLTGRYRPPADFGQRVDTHTRRIGRQQEHGHALVGIFDLRVAGHQQDVFGDIGDGAVNHGMWHEGVNIAAVWKLPLILLCENNLYAASTSISKVILLEKISERAKAYGIPGVTVDGNDVLAVYEATEEAVARARKGIGPTLIECLTYRHGGHSRSDPGTYRPKNEVEEWLKKDPIPWFRSKLVEMGTLTEKEAVDIEKEISEEIERAVKFAKESHMPQPEEALEDIYA